MRPLAGGLALLLLAGLGCTVAPRPGAWQSVHEVPGLPAVANLWPGPGGTATAIGVTGDGHIGAAVFDPRLDSWSAAADSLVPAHHLDSLPLPGGDVLATSDDAVWRFRADQARWQVAAPMTARRFGYTAASLRDGRVLVCGGLGADQLSTATCEVYDPQRDRWTAVGSMSTPRFNPASITLLDGRVFLTGGSYNPSPDLSVALDPLDTSEIFNPRTGGFSAAPAFAEPVTDPELVTLPGGDLLAIGGRQGFRFETATTQALDLRTGRWSLRAPPIAFGKATPLADGRVLALGRSRAGGPAVHGSAAIYDPSVNLWTTITALLPDFAPWDVSRLGDGRALAVTSGGSRAAEWAIYDPGAYPPLPGREGPFASARVVTSLAALVALLLFLVIYRSWRRRS